MAVQLPDSQPRTSSEWELYFGSDAVPPAVHHDEDCDVPTVYDVSDEEAGFYFCCPSLFEMHEIHRILTPQSLPKLQEPKEPTFAINQQMQPVSWQDQV